MNYDNDAKAQCIAAERAYVGERPFSRHDARNTRPSPTMTIAALTDRIHGIAERHCNGAHGIAGQLEQHADQLYGPPPPQGTEAAGLNAVEPYYGEGQLASLFIAVDMLDRRLDEALSRLAVAAGRNSTLA